MVVHALAPVVTLRSQLPDLRALLDDPGFDAAAHRADEVLAYAGERAGQVRNACA